MLVSVTLVLLMMVMFGEIFQIATGSVTKQRVISDNDQNVRTFATVFRADLDKRTMRSVVPFFPGELSNYPGTPFGSRRGYLSISSNNPMDGTDDVLQLTTLVTNSLRNSDETPYYGRAIPLIAGAGGTPALNFVLNPNQPDRDDGQIISNEAASSKAAEVAYFMRGGRLYRRVLLLREPNAVAGVDPLNPDQPTFRYSEDVNQNGVLDMGEDLNSNGTIDVNWDYFLPTGWTTVYNAQATSWFGSIGFWRDFDFSAHRLPTSLSPPAPWGLPINARFHGLGYLSNDQTVLPYTTTTIKHPFVFSLGQTWNRFGHNHEIFKDAISNGLPREYTSASASTAAFIGRFTHEETSKTATAASVSNFGYPQAWSTAPTSPPPPSSWGATPNPMDAATTELSLNATTGAVNEFQPNSTFSRPGVDLLLAHVHEFRVEVWDERLNAFAPVGHSLPTVGVAGDFNASRRLNLTYGPLPMSTATTNLFDTWHPTFNRNFNTESVTAPPTEQPILGDAPDMPPFRPMNYDPTGFSAPMPTNTAGVPRWQPNQSYSRGDRVFEPWIDTAAIAGLPPGLTGNANYPDYNETLVKNNTYRANSFIFSYVCLGRVDGVVAAGQSGASALSAQLFSTTPGRNFTDNELVWRTEYNLRPLRAIRITVRFEHPQSKQMRQVTIVHSLRDTTTVP